MQWDKSLVVFINTVRLVVMYLKTVKIENYLCLLLLVVAILPPLIVIHGLALDTEDTW
jgi:uncharacterized protein YybS (DUF2232 family)